MKKYFIWFMLESKRVVFRLPSLLLGAIVLTIIVGVIAFCGQKVAGQQPNRSKSVIAVAANEDKMTELAVSFVESMESVKDWCRFERTDTETGMQMLQEGEAIALVVLPDKVVEHILNGTNVPAILYLREELPGSTQLFEELAQAGVMMLATAQAEIYASDELKEKYGIEDTLSDMYRDINSYNLNLALNREKLFRIRNVSATGQNSLFLYYTGAGMALFLLCMGMVLPENWALISVRNKLLREKGIGITAQIMGYQVILTLFLTLGSLLPICAIMLVNRLSDGKLTDGLKVQYERIPTVILSLVCAASMILLCRILLRDRRNVLMGLGMGSICMGFLCGCFVPEVLLPQSIQTIGAYLPMTYFREAWSSLLGGQGVSAWSVAVMAVTISGCLSVSGICFARGEGNA